MHICLSSSVDTTIYCRHYSTGLWAMASLSAQSCSPFPVFFSLRSQAGIKISPAHTHWYTHTHDGSGSRRRGSFLGGKNEIFLHKEMTPKKIYIGYIFSIQVLLSLSLSHTCTHSHTLFSRVDITLAFSLAFFSGATRTHARTHLASSRNLVMSSTSSHF